MAEEKSQTIIIENLIVMLEQSNAQIDQFRHSLSHELQQPLRKIEMFSHILQRDEKNLKPLEVTEYLAKIESSPHRLRKKTEDILNFAAVTNYEKLLVKKDLNVIAKSTLFDFELLIEETKATITVQKLPEIEAVPFQMSQLFYDIIDNALKFSQRDVPTVIHITSRRLTKKDRKLNNHLNAHIPYYEITFKDNGIGFEQKYAEKIFTMFQRLSNQGEYPGLGIGLAICKKVVQTLHGKILAEGLEDKDATIHVILPAEQPKKLPENIPTI